jgi:hypothetical protein
MVDKAQAIGKATRFGAVLFVAIVAAGCAHSYPGRVDFEAPAGWIHSTDPTAGETWIKPGGSNESIMAQTASRLLPPHEPGWRDITICGKHPAALMFKKNDSGQLWEAVSTNWNAHRYMAVYVRPVATAPDPAAEKAIRAICLKPK